MNQAAQTAKRTVVVTNIEDTSGLGHRRSDLQRRHHLQLQPDPAKVPGRPRAESGHG
jgi:hypothetical protein